MKNEDKYIEEAKIVLKDLKKLKLNPMVSHFYVEIDDKIAKVRETITYLRKLKKKKHEKEIEQHTNHLIQQLFIFRERIKVIQKEIETRAAKIRDLVVVDTITEAHLKKYPIGIELTFNEKKKIEDLLKEFFGFKDEFMAKRNAQNQPIYQLTDFQFLLSFTAPGMLVIRFVNDEVAEQFINRLIIKDFILGDLTSAEFKNLCKTYKDQLQTLKKNGSNDLSAEENDKSLNPGPEMP